MTTRNQIKALERAAKAGLKIVSVNLNGCRCGGTFRADGTPAWQNRWTCDKCGAKVSK